MDDGLHGGKGAWSMIQCSEVYIIHLMQCIIHLMQCIIQCSAVIWGGAFRSPWMMGCAAACRKRIPCTMSRSTLRRHDEARSRARKDAIESAKRRDQKREETRSRARKDAIKSAKRRDQKRKKTRSKTRRDGIKNVKRRNQKHEETRSKTRRDVIKSLKRRDQRLETTR